MTGSPILAWYYEFIFFGTRGRLVMVGGRARGSAPEKEINQVMTILWLLYFVLFFFIFVSEYMFFRTRHRRVRMINIELNEKYCITHCSHWLHVRDGTRCVKYASNDTYFNDSVHISSVNVTWSKRQRSDRGPVTDSQNQCEPHIIKLQ